MVKRLSRIASIFMVTMLVLEVMVAASTRTVSAQSPAVSIRPESIIGPPPNIGETFKINITVSHVTDLYGWQAGISFNSSVLEALSFVEGPFLKTWAETKNKTTLWQEGNIDNVAGIINYHSCTLTGSIPGATGDGTLGIITFKVKNYGISTLNLTDVILLDSALTEISINVVNAYFELLLVPHNVAVINVVPSSTCSYAGQLLYITVVAMNKGTSIETFNVTAYQNTTMIDTQLVIDLNPGQVRNLTFVWNTTTVVPCANYTISAFADVVPGETNTADNLYIDGTVMIKILGDINGDGQVGWRDLLILAMAYGSIEGEPGYVPEADFNSDGKIDWKDLLVLARNYGKTCP